MAKLTLTVDRSVVARAKRYAKRQGLSASEMVEAYFAMVLNPIEVRDLPPVLRSVRGTLKKADLADYKKHLTAKSTMKDVANHRLIR
jgi:hypothetical protein